MRQPFPVLGKLCLIGMLLAARAWPQTGAEWIIDTIAGRGVGDNGPAITADLEFPVDVAVDGAGNLYISDTENHRIRRVDASGIITTVAGTGRYGYSGDGGPAVAAELSNPQGVAVDGAGNLYIAETYNDRIRRVDLSGTIATIAGTGERGNSGDGGPAVQAQLAEPSGVAVDSVGNLYIADRRNHRIRRVDPSGTIATIAGTGEAGFSGDNGLAKDAMLRLPHDVAMDGAGNLYIADWGNHRIRRVDPSGTIATIAEPLSNPQGMAVDRTGNLYIAETGNHLIRRVDPSGTISTIAGTRNFHPWRGGFSGDGGPAVAAELHYPQGVAVDGAGNLYIADQYNECIRRVDPWGIISTIAGPTGEGYSGDGGPAVAARLSWPRDVAVDGAGNLYIADRGNNCIRRVDPSGIITTIAGTCSGAGGYSGDNGPAVAARLSLPSGVAVDGAGDLYIADTNNYRIRRVDARGIITTIAGTGEYGYSGDKGPAPQAQLKDPDGVAVDSAGNLYIADRENHRIRRVDASGIITTIAGTGEDGYSGDNGPAVAARLDHPRDVAVDGAGNLYIADYLDHRIRRVDASGTITTIAGTGENGYSGDNGPAVAAQIYGPGGVAVDAVGNLYLTAGGRIRRVDASGIITTIAGTGRYGYSGDGGPAVAAELYSPQGVAVDGSGNLYVADRLNNSIRILTRSSTVITLRPPTVLKATAVSLSRIDLIWRDNSTNETGFRVQRRWEGSADWVEIGTTAVNATTFSDVGLSLDTSYIYRVQAFNDTESSAFSNQVRATTLSGLPPTLTQFTPTSGLIGTGVTLTGTHFLGATDVRFNGVSVLQFEVVSRRSLQAVVPPGATSGPISVVTPSGTAVSADPFTVTDGGISSRLFVPIVLRSRGRTAGSFFTSELTLTNRGSKTAAVKYTYTAAIGTGSGTVLSSLGAGRQRVIPDAIAYLTSLGVPIGSGSAGGTLKVDFSNLSSPSDAAVTVRVSTPVEEGQGRAGLAYMGLNPDGLLTGSAFITGLRQNSRDRSNVALQNAGDSSQGIVTLRVTVFSGDSAAPGRSMVLSDRTLPPGGFYQYNGILNRAGFENGYVKVERVSGAAAYYAYGVINDNFNSDGSFVFPVREDSLVGKRGQTLPVIIETGTFTSELTVTNFSPVTKTLDFRFVAEAVETDDDTASFSLELKAGEQQILPQVIDWLRQREVAGIGTADEAFVGAVFATVPEGDMSGIVIGARTSSADGSGGQYGVFYFAVPYGSASIDSAWIYGLQQNEENRSNVALVNTGEVDDSISTFEIDVFEIDHYSRAISRGGFPAVRTLSKTVGPRGWLQINRILGDSRQGYVQVRKVSGNNPFITYGVINDGGAPGERSGDGAYLPAQD